MARVAKETGVALWHCHSRPVLRPRQRRRIGVRRRGSSASSCSCWRYDPVRHDTSARVDAAESLISSPWVAFALLPMHERDVHERSDSACRPTRRSVGRSLARLLTLGDVGAAARPRPDGRGSPDATSGDRRWPTRRHERGGAADHARASSATLIAHVAKFAGGFPHNPAGSQSADHGFRRLLAGGLDTAHLRELCATIGMTGRSRSHREHLDGSGCPPIVSTSRAATTTGSRC